MQFKQPEILYALLLIIIPIIVHLFQLQRFAKTPFTNVQFLKQLKLKTRKSSRLKKWLILLTRILAFTALIFAFAQPYFSDSKQNIEYATTIYLDNSLSMQLKTQQGELLKTAAQKIIENSKNNTTVSLLTNDKIFKNLDQKSLKNELINIHYSSKKTDFNTILLKSKQLNRPKSNTINNLILISDFQTINELNKSSVTNVNLHISMVKLTSKEILNISIDSLYISKTNNKEITLKALLKNTNTELDNLAISLFNDTFLVAKTTTPIVKNKIAVVEFKIPNQENFNGKIVIEDDQLTFDNAFYFAISKPEKINVISIGKGAQYLSKIYTKNEFNFIQKTATNLDYNSIQNQHLIILHELDNIPTALTNILFQFVKNGGNIVVIPSKKINTVSYNHFFKKLNLGSISAETKKELKITTINFSHPLLNGVFEKKVVNFQYPTVNQYYKVALKNNSTIVSYENSQPFLSGINSYKGAVYLFSSPLNNKVTNFKNSPLVVPLYYNFGKYSFKIPQLYYTLGKENRIAIKTNIDKDEVLTLRGESTEFIPLQQVYHNKIELTTSEQPEISGFYKITNKNKPLKTIAFNYNRTESKLSYINLNKLFAGSKNITISNSIEKTFTQLNKQQEIKPLFKWFLALTILFLLLEIFILKFFKA